MPHEERRPPEGKRPGVIAYDVNLNVKISHSLSISTTPTIESLGDRYIKVLENQQALQKQVDELVARLNQSNQATQTALDTVAPSA